MDATERMISRGDERDSGVSGYRRTIETQTSLSELLYGSLPDPPSASPTNQGGGEYLELKSPTKQGGEYLELKPVSNGHKHQHLNKQGQANQNYGTESQFKWPVSTTNAGLMASMSETVTPVKSSDSTSVNSKMPIMASMEKKLHEGERTPLRSSYRQAMGRTGSNSPLHM